MQADDAKSSSLPLFREGQVYHRKREIHDILGGQQQGGISTPAGTPYIFLFTGQEGEQRGYRDGWMEGPFLYTGEGQIGYMQFVRGKRAIRDHRADRKEPILLEAARAHNGSLLPFASATRQAAPGPQNGRSAGQRQIRRRPRAKGSST